VANDFFSKQNQLFFFGITKAQTNLVFNKKTLAVVGL
jgi:hypothetical protein